MSCTPARTSSTARRSSSSWRRSAIIRRCAINYDASHFIKQGLDYVAFIDIYHERIKGFHVKDAEFRPTGKQGFYSGYQPWLKRAARDRSLGDGQVDFKQIFSKFAEYDFDGMGGVRVGGLPQTSGGRGGAKARRSSPRHIIRVTDRAFDDFAATGAEGSLVNMLLGLTDG